MRKIRWVGRRVCGAEEKREMFGVKTEGSVAMNTACPTDAYAPTTVITKDAHVCGARPEAARDRLCQLI